MKRAGSSRPFFFAGGRCFRRAEELAAHSSDPLSPIHVVTTAVPANTSVLSPRTMGVRNRNEKGDTP